MFARRFFSATIRTRPFVCKIVLAMLVTWFHSRWLLWYLPTLWLVNILCNPRDNVILCLWDLIKESIALKIYPPDVVFVTVVINHVTKYRCLPRKTTNPSTMWRWEFSWIDFMIHPKMFLVTQLPSAIALLTPVIKFLLVYCWQLVIWEFVSALVVGYTMGEEFLIYTIV